MSIPSGVTEIGRGAFYRCESLESAIVPAGVTDLPHYVFSWCRSLKSVELPPSLKTIGEKAFYECSSLSSVNDSALQGVTEIGYGAFRACSSLKSFVIPPLLKTIEYESFSYCDNLSIVRLPPALEAVKNEAFYACHKTLTIDLPESVRSVECDALKGCRIRLPTLLPILKSSSSSQSGGAGDSRGLLHHVREAVISSRVDLGVLVCHLASNPPPSNDGFPDVTFKVLYVGPTSNTAAAPLPSLRRHIPEAFFSFPATRSDLISLHSRGGEQALLKEVGVAFVRKVSVYAKLRRCKSAELPKDVLYVMLPFIYGVFPKKSMLREVVRQVGFLLAFDRGSHGSRRSASFLLREENALIKGENVKLKRKIKDQRRENEMLREEAMMSKGEKRRR